MTVNTTSTKITYLGNGSTSTWSFSFPAGPGPNLHVLVTQADETVIDVTASAQININPTIDPNPTSIGGTVVYPIPIVAPPLAVGTKITIYRDVPVVQLTSLSNQSIIYPPVLERALDYLTMAIQEFEEILNRAILLPPDETGPLIFPPCPERANKFLGFDENCDPIAVGIINPVTTTNALRVPADEGIVPLPQRSARPGGFVTFDGAGEPMLAFTLPPNTPPLFFGARLTLSSVHTVTNLEKGFLFQLGGNAYYDFILGDPTTYDAEFSIAVVNVDVYASGGRAKRVLLFGTPLVLYPGQWIYIFRVGNTWVTNPRNQRWRPEIQVTINVDPVLGKDDGTADGLATGAGALRTIANAVKVALNSIDTLGLTPGLSTTVQLAPATYQENVYVGQNTVGGYPITIRGAANAGDPTPYRWNVNGGIGLNVDNNSTVVLRGISFAGIAANSRGVYVTNGSRLDMADCSFLAFVTTQGIPIGALTNSQIDARNISILGNCSIAIEIVRSCVMRIAGAFTVGNGLSWSSNFVRVAYSSMLVGGSSGNITDPTDYHLVGGAGCAGSKYFVGINSIGNLGTGAFLNLPGSVAGTLGFTPTLGTDASMIFN